MKKLLSFLLAITIVVSSCTNDEKVYTIKMPNGALVVASDFTDRYYVENDTVLVSFSYNINGKNTIDDRGTMENSFDVITVNDYTTKDTTDKTTVIFRKEKGLIVRQHNK